MFHSLRPGDPNRRALQERLLAFHAARTEGLLSAQDYDAVVEHFFAMADLVTPEDFGEARIPAALGQVASWVVEKGSPRGDEARVLAGLLVLQALTEDDAGFGERYSVVRDWGRDAREALPGMERYSDMIRVWDEHARLTPSPEVLHTLAELHVQRRDSVLEAFREGPAVMGRMRVMPMQVMRVAPLDVAAVFLRHGDVASAITHVENMGAGGETEGRLLRVLRVARQDDGEAADALIELGEAYREARPEVSRGICRHGLQRFAADPRFPTCLARIAAAEHEDEAATAWYLSAIEQAPTVRGLYDEALARIDDSLERGAFAQNPSQARILAERAESILARRMERWPNEAPPVPLARIELLVGTAEMHAGNAGAAVEHFEASLADDVTVDALLQLGLLQERTGRSGEAARNYRRALDLTPNTSPSDRQRRARILEHLGDAFRADGQTRQSERMYRQALELWGRLVGELEEASELTAENSALDGERRRFLAQVHLRRGVLADRLRERDAMRVAFRAAMMAAPQLRETYAAILSHLVTTAPDTTFAHEVFRLAQRQISLGAEWKVYFGLWVMTVAGREGVAPDGDVLELLRQQADGVGWSGKLARLGVGDLPYAQLLRDAAGLGQETEAHFYEAARRIAAGDTAGARQLLERVVSTNMVSFYEFTMAQHLLQ